MIVDGSDSLAAYKVYLFKFFTILSYANSAINPFLYAFTNDAIKSAFADAFSCVVSERLRDPGDGGWRRRDASAGGKLASVDEVGAAVVDDQAGNALQLEMTTKQTSERQLHVVSDLLQLVTTTDCRIQRVIVHLEEQYPDQQQQQPYENEPDDDKCSV